MHAVQICLSLLALLALSGVVSRHVPIPRPFVQIGIGALTAWSMHDLRIELEPDLFLLLLIPPLLFVDAWRMPKPALVRERTPIMLLAIGLVLFTILGVGHLVHWLVPSIPLAVAFALAAVLSPTDAVALAALTSGSTLPARMKSILQGEALLNDASGLVSFKFALAAVTTGTFSLPRAAGSLLIIGIGGALVGAALVWLLDWTLRLVVGRAENETATESVLLLLLPLGAYVLAEHLGLSGILSAVAAGLMMDGARFFNRGSAELRTQGRFIWELIEFVFNGIIFLLLGLYVPISLRAASSAGGAHGQGNLVDALLLIGAVTLALVGLRFLWVCVTLPIDGWLRRRWQPNWRWPGFRAVFALSLGGLRGAIALAGILSLPQLMPDGSPFASRDLLIEVVTGVILLSLLMGAIGLPLVLRGLNGPQISSAEDAEHSALVDAAKAALQAVRARHAAISLSAGAEDSAPCEQAAKGLIAYYEGLAESVSIGVEGEHDDLRQSTAGKLSSYTRDLRLTGLRAARDELERARQEGSIDDRAVRAVSAVLDLQELAVRGRSE